MMLRPFAIGLDRFAESTYFFSLRAGLNIVIPTPVVDVEDLILVGNGTPDNYVLVILAYHLNGRRVAALAKHEELRGLSVLRDILAYIEASRRLKLLLLLVDRNEENLDELTSEIRRRLNEASISYGEIKEIGEGRIKETLLSHEEREVKLMVLINDIAVEGAHRHTIESHLLCAARDLFGPELVHNLLREARGDPKRAWIELGREKQYQVFDYMIEHRKLVERVFPQHIMALGYLI